ncbi:MAG: hypothetical protein QME79_14760 [Bacillota bacterium]|nr:hypothetical protein [Bacillota bacterium]
MAITQAEIKFYLTGGAGNTDPNASLGGAISNTEIASGNLHNLFDKVTGDESVAGDVEYRCLAVKNTHASLTWEAVRAYIRSNTPGDDTLEIGVETPSGGALQTVVNESTAPTGIVFSAPADRAAGLVCTGEGDSAGNIGPGHWVGIWVKRTVPAGAAAKDNNTATIEVSGDTAE